MWLHVLSMLACTHPPTTSQCHADYLHVCVPAAGDSKGLQDHGGTTESHQEEYSILSSWWRWAKVGLFFFIVSFARPDALIVCMFWLCCVQWHIWCHVCHQDQCRRNHYSTRSVVAKNKVWGCEFHEFLHCWVLIIRSKLTGGGGGRTGRIFFLTGTFIPICEFCVEILSGIVSCCTY